MSKFFEMKSSVLKVCSQAAAARLGEVEASIQETEYRLEDLRCSLQPSKAR